MSKIKIAFVAVVLSLSAAAAARADYTYSQITIPPPAGSAINPSPTGAQVSATSINDQGQVTVNVLGFLPTQTFPDDVDFDAIYNIHTKAFTSFPQVPGSAPASTVAAGINNSGAVVGYFDPGNGSFQGFTYAGGAFTKIDPLGANYTFAMGISNNGQITGGAYNYDAHLNPISGQGFVTSGSSTKPIQALPPAGNYTQGHGINNAGVVVGFAGSFSSPGVLGQTGFVDVDGVVSQIVLPGAPTVVEALGINDSGAILGVVSYDPNAATAEGFIEQNGAFTYLNFPGSSFTGPAGFNNEGDVVGQYQAPDGSLQAFLAVPAPEPAGLEIMMVGLAGLGAVFSMRRPAAASRR